MSVRVDVAFRSNARLGEGPRWDASARRLLWVDILGCALHVFDPATGDDDALGFDTYVCAVAPTADGRILVALRDRLALFAEGVETTVAVVPHGPDVRLNDGACDPSGRFWVGSMALDERSPIGALYRYTTGAGLERVLGGVTLSNGLGWSADGRRMYHIDSTTYHVDTFDYDVESGTIGRRGDFVAVEPAAGTPDGLALDDDGCVWVALYGGAAVRRYDESGRLDRVVELPVSNVTACCFGGDDGRSLFVTTARAPGEPLSGSVFVADAGIGGPPAQPFRHDGGASTAPSEAEPTSAR
jgi:sugar lactone lactonase YvrE